VHDKNQALRIVDHQLISCVGNPYTSRAGAPPQWLKTPSLPRTFVLEILDFVLTNSSAIFRSLPAFENTLSVWISQILMSQLQVCWVL